ncbi:MAG: DUF47 family protein [Puniceicoccales bacterium]|jgi:uncharacterized protein Yka (UPF0111/DUF47 family)|nr:DUF47 family protein [Puniceicoccales bacterium]
MFAFLKKILGRDDKFFVLLDASAQQALESAKLLLRLHAAIGDEQAFNKARSDLSQSRRMDKRIATDIIAALCNTFVTPFEREDIEALASALYKIPKVAEKIGERIAISPKKFAAEFVARQLQMLEKAAGGVVRMTAMLRAIGDMEKIKQAYEEIQAIEGEADKLMLGTLHDLYNGTLDAKDVLILTDIHEHLERSIDLCRDAGKVIFQVALKHA